MLCKLCASFGTVYAVLLCQIKLKVKEALVVFESRRKNGRSARSTVLATITKEVSLQLYFLNPSR